MFNFLLLFVSRALAEGGSVPGGSNSAIRLPNPLRINSLEALLDKVVTGLIYLAVPVVTLMILIGAFQMLFSGGDSSKFEKGKQTIYYALIGLVVVLLARGLADIIVFIFR